MNILYYTTRFKNFIKTNFNYDNKLYLGARKLYVKLIFPIEMQIARNKASTGFESKTALHMCSLLPKRTIDVVISHHQPKTWLDVGCGTGSSLKYVRKKGIKILGLENSELAIKTSKLGSAIRKYDLTKPLQLHFKFDIVWCYEVAEHLPESSADLFLDTLVSHGDHIVLSAATPGQGGDGHINEQPVTYWIKKMHERGFEIEKNLTEEIHLLNELHSKNLYCYRRTLPNVF